jgi:hypothetical protein
MPLMVSEELPMEDALSGCRGVTDRECSLVCNYSETRKGILHL